MDAVGMHVYCKGDGRPRPHLQYLSFLSFSFSASECCDFVAVLDEELQAHKSSDCHYHLSII